MDRVKERKYDGEFNSQSTVARIPKQLHKNLQLIKAFGEFNSLGQIIAIMLNGISLKVGDDLQVMTTELKHMQKEQQTLQKLIKKKKHP